MKNPVNIVAQRYIAGESRHDAVEAARSLNADGILATIDNVGENVENESDARGSVDEYTSLLEEIDSTGVASTVSLKLTHLGLDISPELALENAERITEKARQLDNFVRVDMEGSAYTGPTIDLFLKLHERYDNTGIAIQSCLRRSAADIKLLIKKRASVRLVKGAYKEPPDIAFESKKDVDENFEALMKELLLSGVSPAIATHDPVLVDTAIKFCIENEIGSGEFEFQMLKGIKRGLQKKLAKDGFRVRVYVPYGKNSGPYLV